MSYKRIDISIKETIELCDNNNKYKKGKKSFIRERKMNFKDFIWYLTFQKGRTTSMELDEYLKSKNDTYEISISKQAFSKQRKNIKPDIFIDMSKNFLHDFYDNYPNEVKKYKGHYVLAVDGSLFEIPNTKELREFYKTQKNQKGNRDTARARVSGIYDIENEFMLDAIIADCSKGEKSLALLNIVEAGKIIDLSKTIIIFDRGYPGIEMISFLEKHKIKYIIRVQSNMYNKEKNKMSTEDEWIKLEIGYSRLQNIKDKEIKEELKKVGFIKIRMSKIKLDNGETEYILSNISQEVITTKEMKEVYFKRWKIEIGYDILKNKLHIENFTGKTPITIEQDFFAQIYTFNILQDLKHEASENLAKKESDKKLKYKYKPNINILAGWLKNLVIAIIFAENSDKRKELFDILIKKAEKNLIPIIPNRKNERKKDTKSRNKYKTNLRNNM